MRPKICTAYNVLGHMYNICDRYEDKCLGWILRPNKWNEPSYDKYKYLSISLSYD